METITATTEEVFNHHLEAIRNRNLHETMADYHEDAILITSIDVFKGKAAIQEFFKFVYEAIFTEGFTIEIQKQVVEGDLLFIVWNARSSTFDIPNASDTFLIQDGLIVRQTGFVLMNPV
ncbi:MAG: nuclear transport factor 2 family protein [Bacteroidota bacterium]|nr:nuclear transport factor 2 family protein [Bacteroidota bacterium]